MASPDVYHVANSFLYKILELSFCRCSDDYFDSLFRTITSRPDLAALVTMLIIDMNVVTRVKKLSSMEDLKNNGSSSGSNGWGLKRIRMRFIQPLPIVQREIPKGAAEWNDKVVETLSLHRKQLSEILPRLINLEDVNVSTGLF